MSAGQPSGVDLDLLADYVGGALDGTDQEAAVARLIAADAAWAQAHAWLVRSSGAVRGVLAEWGAAPAPMPADVVGRLTAALTTAAADPAAAATAHATADPTAAATGDGAARATAPPDVPAASGRVEPRVDGPRRSDRPERGSRPPRRRDGGAPPTTGRTRSPTGGRRMPRWATAVAIVAAVVAFAGLGVTYLSGDNRGDVNSTAGLAQREGAAAETTQARPMAGSPPVRVLATGTDYTRTSLAGQVNALRPGDTRASTNDSHDYGSQKDSQAPAPRPEAATDQDGISACVTAIAAAHGRGALRVEWVDSASFEGRPALVVVFADRTGERWAWVVSPECGQPQVGAATRYTARVG